MSSCAYVGQKDVDVSGKKISRSSFGKLDIGETTRAELIDMFGSPTSSYEEDNNVEVLSYHYRKTTDEQSVAFLLWAVDKETTERETTYFKLQDGVLKEYWKEKE